VARYVEVVKKPAPGAERRTAPRLELELEVGLSSESNFYTGLTQDISTGGLFVATHHLRKVGQHVTVHLTLPGTPKMTIDCEVRWIRESTPLLGSTTTGMGLKFSELTPQARLAISNFLRARDSIFYDDE
jgi:uncharacterized protein (TIGR02266 family)